MTSRFERCEALFHEAATLDDASRARFLDRACGDDPELRAEVERLLGAHARAGDFIATPAIAAASAWLSVEEDWMGKRIGPYRILGEIGRGGMGAVYLAERADGQYDQRVALKVIKRGMDTDQVLARFHAERQILASLHHPNIARLLDGGTTDAALPYFVMEYIEGRPIDDYANQRQLSIEARLELFLHVCGAVAYAHQHLVIHRDIKPLNVLVTRDGIPTLLDFGIAKVLHASAEEATFTATGIRLLTPEYASPEQVEGRHATTTSDVYSLGVVLYELLTGRSPYRLRSRAPQDVAVAVCTTEPERPSTSVSGSDGPGPVGAGRRNGSTVEEFVAATGMGTADRLRRRLRGDLDTIVLTALRKEPARRYASVEQFAGDIRRHLDGLPVRARADTFSYRAGKFVRRNRAGVAAAALVALALLGGTVATGWQARQARQAQARAERRFNDVRKLAHAVLFDYHDAIKDLRGAMPVRQRLVRDGLGYLDGLVGESQGDPSLQRELASAYRRMGNVQEDAAKGLGDVEGALASYRKAMVILEPLYRAAPSDGRTGRSLADVALPLGSLVWSRGDPRAGFTYAERARRILAPLVAAAPGDTELRLQLSAAHDLLGQISLEAGEIDRALAFHSADVRQFERAPPAERERPAVRRALSVAYGHLADAQVEANELEGALASHRRSFAIRSALAAEFPDNADYETLVTNARYYEATVLGRLNRWREALERYRLNLGKDSTSAFSWLRTGEALEHLGRHAEALAHYQRALPLQTALLRADSSNLINRLATAEAQSDVCRMLARLRRSGASESCAGVAELIAATPVEPTHAFARAFFAAIWSDLGEAYDTLATAGQAPAEVVHERRIAARRMYDQSVEVWRDLQHRRLVSPTDTARPGAAERALARAEAALHREQ